MSLAVVKLTKMGWEWVQSELFSILFHEIFHFRRVLVFLKLAPALSRGYASPFPLY